MGIPSLHDYDIPNTKDYMAAKVNWQVNSASSAILIHDMQDYFLSFYRKDSHLITTLIDNIASLKAWAKQHNIPVYYTAQPCDQSKEDRGLLTDMWGKGLTKALNAHQIAKLISPNDDDIVLEKWRYSAFFHSNLLEDLTKRGKDTLIICGVYAHIGVLQTAADAFMYGIKPFVIADAVADFSREDHTYALNYVQRNLGRVNTLEDVLAIA